MADQPLPYRLITGPDTREFCERVSQALSEGYVLYGSPALSFNGETIIAAQAVTKADAQLDAPGGER